jgi:AcrR family transcriptional regulator
MRKDAARNRQRIVVAATEALADHGSAMQMEDVAKRAGVGVGTIYGHFPTKDELLLAIAGLRFTRFAEVARAAAEQYERAEAYERFLWDMADLLDRDRALCFTTAAMPGEIVSGHLEALDELRAACTVLIDWAKEAGTLREDFEVDHTGLINCSLGHLIMLSEINPLKDWRKYLGYVIDGLRPAAAAAGRD